MRGALITGCSSGIGRALAAELARRGFRVIATARDSSTLERLDVARRLALDVTSERSVNAAVAQAGQIDVLVNNAGLGLWAPVEAVPMQMTRALFDTNVFGMLRVLHAVLPQMRARKSGLIVQVSSPTGRFSGPLMGTYAATKHAIEALSEALRIELRTFGVNITIVEPGAVATSLPANRLFADLPEYHEFTKRVLDTLRDSMRKTPYSVDYCASAIADIIESERPALRYPVTPDAEWTIARRLEMTDDEWERRQIKRYLPDLS